MKNSIQNPSFTDSTATPWVKRALILGQFFLIIFVYHILKDLKDTLVITSSDAGAQVIPFIKIWVILPFAILMSYLFSKLYQKFGREKTFYFFVTLLLSSYALFAFCLYPFRQELCLDQFAVLLKAVLPVGCKGLIAMVCLWIYTFFYLAAELWGMMILTILFWGYLNEITPAQQAKSFYPLCVFVGNCAGILSGQTSRFLCQSLIEILSWQEALQLMIFIVIVCGGGIMGINRLLSPGSRPAYSQLKKSTSSLTFKESLFCIFQSRPLLCIAILVVGFGLTSNLIEVIWKETIKSVYPLPQAYNAYVNQLTSIIGILTVCISLLARWIFQVFNWSKVALFTPITLFITSFIFFFSMQVPEEYIIPFASWLNMDALYLVMTLGSVYYVLALTAKYTIFDMCKEMAFLSIDANERMRAKSVIDSVGSRLGKSGSSCLYQALLIIFGSTAGHIPIIGVITVLIIGISILATRKLGSHVSKQGSYEPIPVF
jgi:AAA family ATP:ADP antiporter